MPDRNSNPSKGDVMPVASGQGLLLAAGFALGPVIVLAGFAIMLLISRHFRRAKPQTARDNWKQRSGDVAAPTSASLVAPGK